MKSIITTHIQAKIVKRLQQLVLTCLGLSFLAVTLYILINSPA